MIQYYVFYKLHDVEKRTPSYNESLFIYKGLYIQFF